MDDYKRADIIFLLGGGIAISSILFGAIGVELTRQFSMMILGSSLMFFANYVWMKTFHRSQASGGTQ